MYKAIAAAAALAVALTPAPSFAFQDAPDREEADMDRVICKRESVIGSRVQKKRTCMTRREWIALQNKTQEGVDEFLKRATQGADPSG